MEVTNKANGTIQSRGSSSTKKFPIIAIEGIDGSGKTTASKLLASEINGFYFKTPPPKFQKCRYLFEENSRNSLHRFFFYLSILWESWGKIEKISKSKPVVIDRYLLSTKFYHIAFLNNFPEKQKIIEEYFSQITPPYPDFNIILKISPEEAEERLIKANKGDVFDLKIEKDRKLQKMISEFYYSAKEEVHFIEVKGKTPNAIVNECLNILKLN
jgi:UMP-CMP kinase 2